MENVIAAFGLVMDPYVLGVVLVSALFGLFVGAVPGLTATMATALLVPVTYFLDPIPAVACIVTATAMAIFAGDIPGALLGGGGGGGAGCRARRHPQPTPTKPTR
jgi:putative tricarboxylic transport membrane protein